MISPTTAGVAVGYIQNSMVKSPVPKSKSALLSTVRYWLVPLNSRQIASLVVPVNVPLFPLPDMSVALLFSKRQPAARLGVFIAENARSAADYRSGKSAALKFLIGQVMRLSKGKANPQMLAEILERKLKG